MSAPAAPPQAIGTSVFQDPNETAARQISVKLRREILEYQRRLNRLLETDRADHRYLVNACRRAMSLRREMLRDLPVPVDRSAADPWRD